MRVTTWTEYSLILAIHLARRFGSHGPVAARVMAEEEQLPGDYVEQILLRLRRAGIVDSTRGAKGGYRLARPPEQVSVLDVISAAEHQTFEVNCDVHPVDAGRCDAGESCPVRPVWRGLQLRINEFLGGLTLRDLTADEGRVEELVGLRAAS